jgi:hypothetical protein
MFIAIMLLAGSRVFAESKTVVDSSVPSDAVRTIIGEAIDLGVPLYNSGQPEACLAIYRVALRGLLLLAPEEWQILRIPFAAMDLSVRGMKRPFSPPITGGDIGKLGFLIADKQTRPFRMEVD